MKTISLRAASRRLAVALVLLFALGVLAWLYGKTQAAGIEQRVAVEESLREIHQLDSDWNVDIMAAKVGLTESYDPIVAPLMRIREVISRLEADPGTQGARMQQQFEALRRAFATKAELVDEFKSRNSILRNSLRYLPTAADELRTRFPSIPVDAALEESLAYALISDESQLARLSDASSGLESWLSNAPGGDMADGVRGLLGHVRTVKTQVSEQSGLLGRILEVPTVKTIDGTSRAFDARFSELAAQSDFWRSVLVGYAALLLALVAYTANRLRQSYRQIGKMNRALRDANDGLERRVGERTRELGTALQSLRESEAQLIQSEKMSSLGQMVAGIAHEVNTPLAYVRSNLELVHDQLPEVSDLVRQCATLVDALQDPEPDPDRLEKAYASVTGIVGSFDEHRIVEELATLTKDGMHGLDQIRELVVNLRNFSRLDRSRTTRFDLREGLDGALTIAKSELRGHSVEKRYAEIPAIFCAPSQINQVFLNILVNAAQALPKSGGRIRVTTAHEAGQVRVDIADNGCGIPPENLSKIFDPFFTTKEIGKGTGLGLSIAYKIVEEHGGRVSVKSKASEGTVFSIWLPIERRPSP